MRDGLIAIAQAWEGPSGLCALTSLFIFGAMFYVPRFALYITGGAIFGWAAIPAALVGTTAGAAFAFLLARYFLHDRIRRLIATRPALQRLFCAIDTESWRLVAMTRLASPMPGGAINYLFGLTRIALWPYMSATCAGLLLPITIFVTLGLLGRMALSALEGDSAGQIAIAASATVMVGAIVLVIRRMRTNDRTSPVAAD